LPHLHLMQTYKIEKRIEYFFQYYIKTTLLYSIATLIKEKCYFWSIELFIQNFNKMLYPDVTQINRVEIEEIKMSNWNTSKTWHSYWNLREFLIQRKNAFQVRLSRVIVDCHFVEDQVIQFYFPHKIVLGNSTFHGTENRYFKIDQIIYFETKSEWLN